MDSSRSDSATPVSRLERGGCVVESRLITLTLAALTCFALNSLLCRAALGTGAIDAWTFTLVRLASGALVLGLIARSTRRQSPAPLALKSIVPSAAALFLYALPFSLAYRRLSAGTGAFVVFGCVQFTMIGSGLLSGKRLRRLEGVGLAVALVGLAILTRPGEESPDLWSVALMAIAGVSWGVYSLRGRTAGPPLQATARNFAAAAPLALFASLLFWPSAQVSASGLILATASGAITSGLGYVAWYAALPAMSPARAAIVQLAVPPLASFLGVVLLAEAVTSRLLMAAPMILGGIAIALLGAGAQPTVPPVVRQRGSG